MDPSWGSIIYTIGVLDSFFGGFLLFGSSRNSGCVGGIRQAESGLNVYGQLRVD